MFFCFCFLKFIARKTEENKESFENLIFFDVVQKKKKKKVWIRKLC